MSATLPSLTMVFLFSLTSSDLLRSFLQISVGSPSLGMSAVRSAPIKVSFIWTWRDHRLALCAADKPWSASRVTVCPQIHVCDAILLPFTCSGATDGEKSLNRELIEYP